MWASDALREAFDVGGGGSPAKLGLPTAHIKPCAADETEVFEALDGSGVGSGPTTLLLPSTLDRATAREEAEAVDSNDVGTSVTTLLWPTSLGRAPSGEEAKGGCSQSMQISSSSDCGSPTRLGLPPGALRGAIAAADAKEHERRVAAKLGNYRAAVEAGKGHIEREHAGRKVRFQEAQHQEALHLIASEEERRLLAKCKVWTTDDFESLRVLGEGSFGVVHLVRRRNTEEYYALKQMRKSAYRAHNQRQRARCERDILAERQSRWFVKLFATFQDAANVYMVMEFLQGGDLCFQLDTRGSLTVQETCFYMAELLEALDTVHQYGFVHRDVKPDNIVFASNGHLKLLDFGLCGRANTGGEEATPPSPRQAESPASASTSSGSRSRLQSTVGTPQYIAPEVYKGAYGTSADLWALGLITIECLTGRPLFDVRMQDAPLEKALQALRGLIANHERILEQRIGEVRACVPPSAERLLLGLICDAETPRLSAAECREEPFFAGINFRRLHLMEPPLKFQTAGPQDASFFDVWPQRDLPPARLPDLINRDRALEWAHYEFDSRAHGTEALVAGTRFAARA